MLKKGDYVGIAVCSDARKENEREKIERLCLELKAMGLVPVLSGCIYEKEIAFSTGARQRVEELMRFYQDDRIKAVFDISGGDMCNEILDKIDYDVISKNEKPFFGYSDITALMNAIYRKTGNPSCLYQIRNLVGSFGDEQKRRFSDSVMSDGRELFDFEYKFIRGEEMKGVVLGGNMRCLLKLAGTEFMPDFTDKIILLESLGGGAERTVACISQLRQLGVFNRVSGVLLGEFTYMTQNNCRPTVEEIILRETGNAEISIARTQEIGHSHNSKAIMIGEYITLN